MTMEIEKEGRQHTIHFCHDKKKKKNLLKNYMQDIKKMADFSFLKLH